jgi:hypothetical protein
MKTDLFDPIQQPDRSTFSGGAAAGYTDHPPFAPPASVVAGAASAPHRAASRHRASPV